MKCGFCGRTLSEQPAESPCGRCIGGCRKIHCPWCGHENPATPRLLRRLAGEAENDSEDETP